MQGNLKNFANRLYSQIPALDLYGRAVYTDAARYPKSLHGALVSLICYGVAMVVIVFSAMKLSTAAMAGSEDDVGTIVSIATKRVKFNSLFEDAATSKIIQADDGRWDLPTLQLQGQSDIKFFNSDSRRMFKIELLDNHGYGQTYMSDRRATPVAASHYEKVQVPLNSFNADFSQGRATSLVNSVLNAGMSFKGLHTSNEVMQVIRVLANQSIDFHPHQTHVYVRLPKRQMRDVKMCQFQVALMNQGEYMSLLSDNSLNFRENQSSPVFPSMTSDPATWSPQFYGSKPPYGWAKEYITLLDIEAETTYESRTKFLNRSTDNTVSEADFSAWRLEFNYVNNFLEVTNEWTCGGSTKFNIELATTDPPDATQDKIVISPVQDWPNPPFQIVMRSESRSEIAEVIAVDDHPGGANQTLTLKRKNATDFSKPSGKYPDDWQCPLSWYNDSVSCDCNCGAPDADCDPSKGLPVSRCPLPYSTVNRGSMCSRSGLCTTEPPQAKPQIKVSEGCWRIFAPGEVNLIAFMGSLEKFQAAQTETNKCVPCPADTIYDGQAAMGGDGVFRCFAQVTGNINLDLPPNLIEYGDAKVAELRAMSDSAPSAAATPPPTTPPPNASNSSSANGTDAGVAVAACKKFSTLWNVCTDPVLNGLETWIYARFEATGMSFPVVSMSSAAKPVVEVLLENAVTFEGQLVYSEPPKQAMQFMILRPLPTAPQDASSTLQMVDAVLYSVIDFETTSLVAGCSQRLPDSNFACYRTGVDKNFVTRIGRNSIHILDTLKAAEITGIAARAPQEAGTTYLHPECGDITNGECSQKPSGSEGIIVDLRMTRPMPVNVGRRVILRAFTLCEDMTASRCEAGKRHQLRTTEMVNLFDDIIPFPYNGNAAASGAEGNGNSSGGNASGANASSGGGGNSSSSVGGDGSGAGDGSVIEGEYVFPVDKRPIVIIRSRGQVVEMRMVNKTAGKYLVLDSDVEGDIDFPATIETTYDGEPHSCTPSHHPCIHTLFRVRVKRDEPAYLPSERYLRRPAEPTLSPEQLDLEVAIFRVPSPFEEQKVSSLRRSEGGGGAEGGESGGFTVHWERGGDDWGEAEAVAEGRRTGVLEDGSGSSRGVQEARRQGNATVAQAAAPATTPAGTASSSASAQPRKQYLCPNLASSNAPNPAFRGFGWDEWRLRERRDFEVQSCTDTRLSSDDCKDLESIPEGEFRLTCNKAMPPTYDTQFKFKVPVNNKWKAPKDILERNGEELINRPEFEFDFSLLYHLQYSRTTMESDAAFATNVNQGDFTPRNDFRVYSGAPDFMGVGGGRDAYQNLKNVLPANPPILANSIELGVDPNFALYDIQMARNATGGKAASMWPKTENGLKLALEKFPPLRIEWELSTLGGRSDDQVIVMQPGFQYVLEALVQIRPIYSSDIWESGKIMRWERQVVSTAATKTLLTNENKLHEVEVRYVIRFDPLVQAQTFKRDFTVVFFIFAVGSAAGYVVFGAILLNFANRLAFTLPRIYRKHSQEEQSQTPATTAEYTK